MGETSGSTRDLRIERSFDAPVALVWQLWTDAEHFKAWYGPEGASIPTATMDVRVGGPRQVCMEVPTPNGPMQMWFTGEYREVVEHRRLVYTESMSDEREGAPPTAAGAHGATEVRVDFEDLGTRTRIVLVHAGIPEDSPGAMGWTMALDKLAARLARATESQ
jgi:uncharacterized protein YndB with AHSA1/START domain